MLEVTHNSQFDFATFPTWFCGNKNQFFCAIQFCLHLCIHFHS